MNIKDWFFDVVPFRRRSSADWILPSIAGLGVGLAVGIGIGLLTAPSTGEEARLRLREGASRVKDKAATFAEKAKSQLHAKSEQLHAKSEQLQNQVTRS